MRAYLLHDVEIEVVAAMRTLDLEGAEMVHRFTITAAESAARRRALKPTHPAPALAVSNDSGKKPESRKRTRAKRPALQMVGGRP